MDPTLIQGLTNVEVIKELGLPYAIILLLFFLIFFLLWRDGKFRKAKDELIKEQHTVISEMITSNAIFQSEMVNQFHMVAQDHRYYNDIMHNFAKHGLVGMIMSEEGIDLSDLNNQDLRDLMEKKKDKIKQYYESK